MGKNLIITEKPSVAQEFAKVLHVNGRGDGYIENQDYVISWCVGHLVGLVYPESYDIKYKKWKLEDLPFLPKDYKYDVIPSVRKQYDIVHGLLQRDDIDRVYWAGDAGKEGQTIEENIRNFGGVRDGMEELRVWIDSQTQEEILRGIKEAKPMSEYENLGKSGIMRTIEDYAMGINFSRVMSVKYGNLLNGAAATKSYTAIAVGRVMTCVLGMVVIREREIRNFKETPFYRVIGKFSEAQIEAEWKAVEGSKYFESPLLYKENGFKEEKDALALMEELNGQKAIVKSIEKTTSRKRAPLLFNLAELQAECSKKFKISPDETLQIAQDLYEKKLTTYPRTDARVLSSAVAKEISRNISRLKGFEPVSKFAENIMAKRLYSNIADTQYTDDSKVTDHYAIIPTGQLTELNSLNSLQKAVFELICRRFLSIFYPPAEYDNVKLVVAVLKENFFASAKVLKSEGYLEVATPPKKKSFAEENARILGGADMQSDNNEKENQNDEITVNPKVLLELAGKIKSGDEISSCGYSIKFGKTSPPKRYTSGSMVLAMENAGQLIEDEELREQIKGSGIGTSATRAEIINKLVRIGYLNLNRKTQILSPENMGEMVFEVVYMTVPALLNPKMTANWEKGLDGITKGTVDFWEYRTKLEHFIRTETEKMIGQNIKDELADRISSYAGKNATGAGARRKIGVKCPVCGGEMVTTPFGYGCGNYKKDKSGCNFNIGEIAGMVIPEEQVRKLIENGITDTIRGFKSKTGRKFDACLRLNKDEQTGKVSASFDFENVKPQKIEGIVCPDCGGEIYVTPYGYRCANLNREQENGCHFSVGKIADKALSQVQFIELIANGKTETIRGFKSKNGKKFNACLALKKDEKNHTVIAFDFDNVEDEIVKDVVCPACHGAIKKTPFGFGCVNYKGNEPGSCRFSIGQIAGKTLTVSNVKQLLNEKRTETIRGFKAKSGKKFDACLVLKEDENGKPSVEFDFEHVEAKKIADIRCPLCGGDIVVTPFGYGCANYENSCRFSIGKMADKSFTEAQVKQLLNEGITETIRGFKAKSGKKFDARVALSKDEDGKVTGLRFDFDNVEAKKVKDVRCPKCGGAIVVAPFGFVCENNKKDDPDEGDITFDFPEKPKPAESDVKCPKCGKNLMKTQWKYECECGFEVWHTIAKVELTEEIMTELLTTGKTKNKVAGFTSKAGNIFDSCLKYENGQISFDFDNPGEADPAAESKKAEMQSPGMQSAGVQNLEIQSSGIESPEMNSGSEANNVTDNNTNDTQDIGIPEDFMAGLEIPQEDDQNNISDADMAAAYELFEN